MDKGNEELIAHPQETKQNPINEKPPIKTHARQPLSRKIKGVLRELFETLVATDEKISPENITLQKTADIINNYVSHPSNKRRGFHPEEIPFDITDMLVQMGYTATFLRTGDFMKKHPQAYNIIRKRLSEVSQKGGIQMKELSVPSSHGETIAYQVADLKILRKIASGEIKPPNT